jgi:hypothetical protein
MPDRGHAVQYRLLTKHQWRHLPHTLHACPVDNQLASQSLVVPETGSSNSLTPAGVVSFSAYNAMPLALRTQTIRRVNSELRTPIVR